MLQYVHNKANRKAKYDEKDNVGRLRRSYF